MLKGRYLSESENGPAGSVPYQMRRGGYGLWYDVRGRFMQADTPGEVNASPYLYPMIRNIRSSLRGIKVLHCEAALCRLPEPDCQLPER